MIKLLQTTPADTLNVEAKITEVIETVKNTPIEILVREVLNDIVIFGLKVIAAIILYLIGIWIIRRIKRVLGKIFETRQTDSAIATFIMSITSIVLMIILIIIIVGTLGIDTTSLAALLAGGGMAIGMALNGTVQNFAGGIMILIFRPFKAGDYIQAQGYEGTVTEVSITSTKLTSTDNRVIVIPNGLLFNGVINNFSHNTMRRLDITLDVEYGTSAEQTKSLLSEIIDADSRILTTEKGAPDNPIIALNTLKESGVEFVIKVWVKKENYWPVRYELLETCYKKLPENGIQFPFPKLDVTLKQN
jgi:small conductance mechanosensitive channel